MIDQGGWRVIDSPPVYFHRSGGMKPLPEPVAGGSLKDDLKPLLNVKNHARRPSRSDQRVRRILLPERVPQCCGDIDRAHQGAWRRRSFGPSVDHWRGRRPRQLRRGFAASHRCAGYAGVADDRAYQIATAYFYRFDYGRAAELYAAIGADGFVLAQASPLSCACRRPRCDCCPNAGEHRRRRCCHRRHCG